MDPTEFYAHLAPLTAAADLCFSQRQSAGAPIHTVNRRDTTHVFPCPINALSRSVEEELAPSARLGVGTTRTGTAGQITMTDGCGTRNGGSGGPRMPLPNKEE